MSPHIPAGLEQSTALQNVWRQHVSLYQCAVQVESDVEVAEPLEEPAALAEEAPADAEASGSAPAEAEVGRTVDTQEAAEHDATTLPDRSSKHDGLIDKCVPCRPRRRLL